MTQHPGSTSFRAKHRQVLLALGLANNGVLTAAEARGAGVTSSALSYHSRHGGLERLGHGVYRVVDFPSGPHAPLVVAAAALGKDAIVSHESALKIYDVSDVTPSRLHFTIPRSRRYARALAADVEVHTASKPIASYDQIQQDGFRVTSLARSIIDSARTGTAPEQIVMAVREGLRRGLVTHRELTRAIDGASVRVRRLVEENFDS